MRTHSIFRDRTPRPLGTILALAALCAAALPAACNPSGVPVAPGGGGTGTVAGRVQDLDGRPVPGAVVSLAGGPSATSTADGRFLIRGAQPQVQASAAAASPGYITGNTLLAVEAGKTTVHTFSLIPRAPAQQLNAATGGRVSFADGGSVSIPPASLVDANGRPATGEVSVRATYIDPNDPRQVDAAPGNYLSRDSLGRTVAIETRGMVEVVAFDARGGALQLARGQQATLTWPASTRMDGNLYEFSSTTGFWDNVAPIERQISMRRIALYNVDKPIRRLTCVRVTTSPRLAGVRVVVRGPGYRLAADGVTDDGGTAVVAVPASDAVRIGTSSFTAPSVRVQASAPAVAAPVAGCGTQAALAAVLPIPSEAIRLGLLDGTYVQPTRSGTLASLR
ncbi:MAG TPA: carboxypeptidase regulatory-like domain-containing protein [Longimicrobium sp.]|nr:carboxypeptidase regulatory-like domain-containing protein [Longimicrobium sp.]